MTCFDPDPARSTFELPLQTATARMAALQGETERIRAAATYDGTLHGVRTTIGRGLIALGSVITPAAAPNATPSRRTAVSR
jgi:hypothetical protein